MYRTLLPGRPRCSTHECLHAEQPCRQHVTAHISYFLVLLQALAATAPNSQERFEARRVLPGMASRLRQVCSYL